MENYKIALAGNPNVGKSTVFNSLTRNAPAYRKLDRKNSIKCSAEHLNTKKNGFEIVDLPGTYSLNANSEEEEIARDYILSKESDLIIAVLDATSLERNLNLVYQILEITKNVIVCVNLLDEAKKKGIHINLKELSAQLKTPVVGVIARKKKTLKQLLNTIYNYTSQKKENRNEDYSSEINEEMFSDESTYSLIIKSQETSKKVCKYKNKNYQEKQNKIDKILTSKLYGIPIMIGFLGLVFWITIVGANYPSTLLANIFETIQEKLNIFLQYIKIPIWLNELIIEGIYEVVSSVISVMLPPMLIFFPLFTFLEDLGYLPRIAFNLDNCFRKACTSGKQALTMCMGFGCNAVGVTGTRIISQNREKIIAILTNVFVPCNGRFPLLIIMSSILVSIIGITNGHSIISSLIVLATVLFGIYLSIVISKILSITLLKGTKSTFMLELPPYRKPQIGKILIRSILDRSLYVLGRAVIASLPAGIIIWILANIGIKDITLLQYMVNFLNPFAQLMGLDGHILTAFILGIPANEIVLPIMLMSYLKSGVMVDTLNSNNITQLLIQNGWTAITAINVMIFALLHFPCATTLMTIKKETKSIKWTILSFVIPTLCGIIICMVTNLVSKII